MGADSRATAGNIIADKHCEKVHKITESIYACGAGTAADLDQVTKMLSSNLRLMELNTGKKARVITAMRQAKQHLFNYQGYIGAYLLIGGVDPTGPHLYECTANGTTMHKEFAAQGSGSYAAISILERDFKPKMTEAEAKDLVQRALHAAESNFQNFFQFVSIAEFTDKFCIYNINAPGQEMDAKPLPENFQYPTMEGLANIVENVVEHFKLPHFFAFGVGLGANVLLRYTLMNQDRVNALILVNCVHSTCGWVEWGYEKVNQRHLKNYGMTSFVADYLMWHHFGRRIDECSSDIVRQYRVYFQHLPNPTNLSMLIDAYINRTPINFSREGGAAGPQLKVPVLQLVGAGSAFVNETVEVNTRLDPSRSDWIKVSGSCGLVLDDRPEAVTEALMLFLQGLGYFPTMNVVKLMKQIHEAQSGSYAAEQRCVDEC
ncbi:unnamed protein product, partial [Mesorhabditis spiculigera]